MAVCGDFVRQLQERQAYIDRHLVRFMPPAGSYPPVIHQAMHYAVFNGGKRLRPTLVLEAARAVGGEVEKALPTACAIEMIHCYSLVHDDLPAMDDDDLRRGKPTCHKVFGEANAILTGDALLTLAFEVLAGSASIPGLEPVQVMKVIHEVAVAAGSQGMIGGQVLDLEAEGAEISLELLKDIHSRKTGALFRACLRSGSMLFGVEDERLKALTRYAESFGLGFQVTDDILDVEGDEQVIGKPVGSDRKNEKATYPYLLGLDEARRVARTCIQEAVESLAPFGPEADFLRNLAHYVLERQS
ncbi:MAG: polyprenyl synthetase family protein [Syntrophomonadaceae bacterium]|nr:polyprenyl synthetase family protein [Syntrophomonadaceae bacterium]